MISGIFGAVLMAAFGIYYFRNKKRNRKCALFCKALATSVPGFLLLAGLHGTGTLELAAGTDIRLEAAAAGTLSAILFYMAADVLLECRFIWGAVCFSIGHICMALGFLLSGESVLRAEESGGYIIDTGLLCLMLAVCVVFVVSACAVLHRYFPSLKKKRLFYPLLGYVLVLSVMSSLAVAAGAYICLENCGTLRAAGGLIPLAGGLCFAVSDVLLGRNRMGKHRSVVCGALVLILYYTAVYFFTMRLWIYTL